MPKKKNKNSTRTIKFGDDATVKGDVFTGDKITASDHSAIATGPQGKATVTSQEGVSGGELSKIFEAIYQKIESRPTDPDVEKEEIRSTVKSVEAEIAKGEEANENKVGRWLRNLLSMAPDIFDVTIASLTSPVSGLGTAMRKIIEKAKKEAEQK